MATKASTPERKPANEMVTVLRGEEMPVTYLDGSTEIVKVCQLRADSYQRYALLIDDEPATLELFCEKEKGWAERLSPESYDAVAEKGHGLNFPFFRGWFRRKLEKTELMQPAMIEAMQKMVAEKIADLQLPSSSSPSPGATG